MLIPAFLLQHQVTIEPFLGTTGYGEDEYGPPVTVACFVDAKRRLVRNAEGSEVVSETTIYGPLGTVAHARSRVTLPDGRTPIVINALDRDGGGLPVPSHLEIVCE